MDAHQPQAFCMQGSEGRHGHENQSAHFAQPHHHAQHSAVPDPARTEGAAAASIWADAAQHEPVSLHKGACSYSTLQEKSSTAAGAGGVGVGIAEAEPTRSDVNETSAWMRAADHPAKGLQSVGSSSAWTTLPLPTQAPPRRPGEGATVKERLVYIGKQLDAFGRRGVILKQFEMLGGDDRCIGGALLHCVAIGCSLCLSFQWTCHCKHAMQQFTGLKSDTQWPGLTVLRGRNLCVHVCGL